MNLNPLLKWSLNPEGGAPNTALLQQLFGAKDEAKQMVEAMDVIQSDDELEAKLAAFDELQMLIENLDNANNLGKLGIWPPLLSLLQENATLNGQRVHAELRAQAAWACGIAVQNNAPAQEELFKLGGVAILVLRLGDEDSQVRVKAISALRGLLHNHPPSQSAFVEEKGWLAIKGAITGEQTVGKAAFFVGTLVRETDSVIPAVREGGVTEALADELRARLLNDGWKDNADVEHLAFALNEIRRRAPELLTDAAQEVLALPRFQAVVEHLS